MTIQQLVSRVMHPGLVPVVVICCCVLTPACNRDAQEQAPAGQGPGSPRTSVDPGQRTGSQYEVVEVYAGLRNQVLRLEPNTIELTDSDPSTVIALLMETGYADAVATLVAVADGSASIYFSSGGGMIGGGHEPVQRASTILIETAHDYVQHATLTDDVPLPQRGNVRFYLVTPGGVYTIEAPEDDLGNNGHPFSPLFHGAQDLITAIRENVRE